MMSGGAIWPVRLPGGSTACAGSSVGPLDGDPEADEALGEPGSGVALLLGVDGTSSARELDLSHPDVSAARSRLADSSTAVQPRLRARPMTLAPPALTRQG
jgi:hypothetical protein